ncbi:lactate utilization protein [Clostridium sp. 'White wine YQ']|uniref:lactate utilization protein n=1 Tax=Clostridium sp. 'White wine YQ' TaxID=3027474 RepID=UPI00236623F1|nr:lactate utilization protein [Clostridium sp. 'White wine YQ']MDD7793183.1 lactate utilization protein [Clostridium sp. 'White wine YQ']
MDNNISWYIEKQVERTINNLNNRNMEGYFVKDRYELINKVKEFISIGSNVGVGDSLTLSETGVLDLLRNGDYNFFDKYKEDLTKENKREIYIKNFGADSFVSSTNAITENGELYNIDGNGSRVAPMLYGPNQVIIVVGINKIVKDIEAAEKRVRQYSAPIDAKRLNKDTPCTKIGYCVDCKSPNRICNDFVIIRGQFIKGRIKVIIVGESLGY